MFVRVGTEENLLTPETDQQFTSFSPVEVSENVIYFLTNHDTNLTYLAKFDLDSKTFEKVFNIENEDFIHISYSKKDQVL
jgi:hypothetical protein